ncbi:hypothetical protein FACS1894151_04050 [Spirochaetia bacterium]|nr:hypothetical protein FACS1894151_04050 [Spirochaetia bacterium]
MKTSGNSLESKAKMSIEEIVVLLNLKDEEIDTSDIPEVTDFSKYHLANEDQLKKIPKAILRALAAERLRTIEIVGQLSKKTVSESSA